MKKIIFFNILIILFCCSCNDNTSKKNNNENTTDIQETTIDYKGLVQLLKLECNVSNKEGFYKLNCQNIRVANEIEEGKNNIPEIITVLKIMIVNY